jgi:hypothetical protein
MARPPLSGTLLALLLVVLSLALAHPAHAQEGAADDAWRKYDAAFEALLAGRRDEALRMLAEVAAAGPTHPAAGRAKQLLALQAAEAPQGERESIRREAPTRGARAELASFQTFHGIAVGVEVCLLTNCQSSTGGVALMVLGGGAGLTLSLMSASEGIRPGTTALLDSGVVWGAWNAIAIGVAGDFHSQAAAGGLLVGQGLGLGAGAALSAAVRPTAGQVSLANTVGLWSGLITLFARGADQFSGSRQSIMLTLLSASDVGLAGGALLAAHFPVSRGHALLIDAGGAAGALSALGVTALVGGNGTKSQTYFLAMIPGTLVGLAASAYLTRHWDAPHLPTDLALAVSPLADGHGATAGVGGRF